jgi:hypothetical protein
MVKLIYDYTYVKLHGAEKLGPNLWDVLRELVCPTAASWFETMDYNTPTSASVFQDPFHLPGC